MRLLVELRSRGVQAVPWDYPHKLASSIYRALERVNPPLAYKLHRLLRYRPFTFSQISGPSYQENGVLYFKPGKYRYFFSTPDQELFSSYLSSLLSVPSVRIGRAELEVERVKVLEEPRFNGEPVRMNTLSPILVRGYKEGKRNPHWDLSPREPKFFDNMERNLRKRYSEFYGKEPQGRMFFLELRKLKEKRVRIRNTYHRAWHMEFVVSGSPDLLTFGYQAGFGEKTGMGFGMVGV